MQLNKKNIKVSKDVRIKRLQQQITILKNKLDSDRFSCTDKEELYNQITEYQKELRMLQTEE